jgi:hypothetical protein
MDTISRPSAASVRGHLEVARLRLSPSRGGVGAAGAVHTWRRREVRGEGKPSWRRRDAGAGVGISPQPGAGCPARTSLRQGTGRAGGMRLECGVGDAGAARP